MKTEFEQLSHLPGLATCLRCGAVVNTKFRLNHEIFHADLDALDIVATTGPHN